jgi:hypothetical protein
VLTIWTVGLLTIIAFIWACYRWNRIRNFQRNYVRDAQQRATAANQQGNDITQAQNQQYNGGFPPQQQPYGTGAANQSSYLPGNTGFPASQGQYPSTGYNQPSSYYGTTPTAPAPNSSAEPPKYSATQP